MWIKFFLGIAEIVILLLGVDILFVLIIVLFNKIIFFFVLIVNLSLFIIIFELFIGKEKILGFFVKIL